MSNFLYKLIQLSSRCSHFSMYVPHVSIVFEYYCLFPRRRVLAGRILRTHRRPVSHGWRMRTTPPIYSHHPSSSLCHSHSYSTGQKYHLNPVSVILVATVQDKSIIFIQTVILVATAQDKSIILVQTVSFS